MRDRCDPTDPSCEQGGMVGKSLEVQPPPKVANVEITDKVRLYVLLGFPHSVDGFADNWCGLLMHPIEKDDGEAAVEAIIQEAKSIRGVTIEQLAYAKDSLDREAYAVATKHKRRYLNKHLLLLGRSKSIHFALVWRSPLPLV